MSLSYATVAGLPPVYGLYAAFVAIIPYFFFGTSPHLSNGPTAVMSMLVRQSIPREYHEQSITEGSEQWIQLVFTISFVTGMLQFIFGIFRFGIFLDLISEPVVSAFTSATAILIIGGQVPGALGIKKCDPTELWGASHADDECYLPEIVYSVMINLHDVHLTTFLFTIISCIILWIFKNRLSKIKLVLGSMGPLFLVTLWLPIFYAIEKKYGLEERDVNGTIKYFDAHWHVRMIGPIESGLPSPESPFKLVSNFRDIVSFLSPCLAIAVVGFMEAMTIAKSIAKKTGRGKLVANNELMALGASNIACSFFQGFPVTGSLSRTAVNAEAGARSPISSLCASIVCGAVLMFFTSSMQYLPRFVLATIVIMSSIGLVNFREALDLWQVFRRDFIVFAIVFVGTLMVGVENGLLLGVLVNWVAILMHRNQAEAVVFVENIDEPGKLIDVTSLPDPRAAIQSARRSAFKTQQQQQQQNQQDESDVSESRVALNSTVEETNANQYVCAVAVLVVHDNLIFSAVEAINRSIESVRHAFSPQLIILDLSHVQTIDSSGIQFLKEIGHTLSSYGILFRVASIRDQILGILHRAYERIPELQHDWLLKEKGINGNSASGTAAVEVEGSAVVAPDTNGSTSSKEHEYFMSIHDTVGSAIMYGKSFSSVESEVDTGGTIPLQARMKRQNTSIMVDYEILNAGSPLHQRITRHQQQKIIPSFVKTNREPFIVIPVPDYSYYPPLPSTP